MKKEEKKLEELLEIRDKLYGIFMASYYMEGSRGYRPDLRVAVESDFARFNSVNEKLPEEYRIKNNLILQLSQSN